MSVFLNAVQKGNLRYIQQQINARYPVNRDRDSNGNTALLIASDNGFNNIVSILIASGADKEARNYLGQTPLILASIKGHEEVVLELIRSRVNLNRSDNNNHTALIESLINNRINIANILLDNNADIGDRIGDLNAIDYVPQRIEYQDLETRIRQIYNSNPGRPVVADILDKPLIARINLGNNICAVCLDKYINNENDNLVILNCGHIFHEKCFRDWRSTYNKPPCPICKLPITNIRPLQIDNTPGEAYTGKYFLGGNYQNKLQKYLIKLNNI
jgi:ankyrin repeat protein